MVYTGAGAGERFAGRGDRAGAAAGVLAHPQGQVVHGNAGPGNERTRHPISMSLSSPFTFDRLPSSQATF
jgi:hypothetical protein